MAVESTSTRIVVVTTQPITLHTHGAELGQVWTLGLGFGPLAKSFVPDLDLGLVASKQIRLRRASSALPLYPNISNLALK